VRVVQSLQWQITIVVTLAPRQIDRGDVGWHYWRTQKQGSAEAVPVGSKSVVIALLPNYSISQLFNICQILNNCMFIYN
jgi:hypothetical protein